MIKTWWAHWLEEYDHCNPKLSWMTQWAVSLTSDSSSRKSHHHLIAVFHLYEAVSPIIPSRAVHAPYSKAVLHLRQLPFLKFRLIRTSSTCHRSFPPSFHSIQCSCPQPSCYCPGLHRCRLAWGPCVGTSPALWCNRRHSWRCSQPSSTFYNTTLATVSTAPTTSPVHQRLLTIFGADHPEGLPAALSWRFDQISCRRVRLPPTMLCLDSLYSRLLFVVRFSAVRAATYSIRSLVRAEAIKTFGLFAFSPPARNKKWHRQLLSRRNLSTSDDSLVQRDPRPTVQSFVLSNWYPKLSTHPLQSSRIFQEIHL